MKTNAILYTVMVAAMCFIPSAVNAQTAGSNQSNTGLMYLLTEDITVEKFQQLQHLLKTNNAFKVKEACVPAQVLSVRVLQSSGAEQAFNEFKVILNSVDITAVSLKADYDDTKFLQKCSSARTVN